MLGGLTIYPRVANFLQCMRAKNYENWLAFDIVIAKIIRLTFFGPPCISWCNFWQGRVCHALLQRRNGYILMTIWMQIPEIFLFTFV